MFPERQGLIIWIQNARSARALERFGAIHYVSRKLNYVVMYVNKSKVEETTAQLERLNFVKKIELSYRNELKTEYSSKIPKKTSHHSF